VKSTVRITLTGASVNGQPIIVQPFPVNIVKVVVQTPPDSLNVSDGIFPENVAFVAGRPHDAGNVQTGVIVDGQTVGAFVKVIEAGVENSQSEGLAWRAQITLLGPANNSEIDKIHVGFIQHVTVSTLRGHYTTNPRSMLVSTLESLKDILDCRDVSDVPYVVKDKKGVFFDATPTANSKQIRWKDSPKLGAPLGFGGAGIDKIEILVKFTLDIVASGLSCPVCTCGRLGRSLIGVTEGPKLECSAFASTHGTLSCTRRQSS
jgi:hypothetical protein